MTPRDSWDYDDTAQITMADLTTDVQKRHVAVHASNNGSPAAAAPTPAHQGG
jgi:glucose dehydrogenase